MLTDKKVLAAGAGESGLAAARLLSALGARVTVTDQKAEEELPGVRSRVPESVGWLFGPQTPDVFEAADLIVISPGVPYDHPGLTAARSRGIEVIGEMELGFRYMNLPVLAVTGSNGKTSTTSLAGHILAKFPGKRPFVGGNIGNPLCNLAAAQVQGKEAPYDWAVLEVSSFQLETVSTFAPKGAAVLNITPDHLDRHGDMIGYFQAKCRILENLTGSDWAILNEDDLTLACKNVPGIRFGFSRKMRPPFGGFVSREIRKDYLVIAEGSRILAKVPWADFRLEGSHNQENVLAACGLAMAAGIDPAEALPAAADFAPGDHRLQLVAEINGVRYYDDSKGTNVGAVARALENFSESIVLIAGGRDKNLDFGYLRPLVKKKVKNLILIGESRDKMKDAFSGASSICLAGSLEEAVSRAFLLARPGQVVLLSPACASFDMFSSYKERGEVFIKAVSELKNRPLPPARKKN
ncbi:MAG: UDP-N-acetylmuramoyl-L-alanine--D-glutamate ligase [Deltaproteobacteria bacterium]|nr:UDP-N-acetylmuramoyl-L-alanine--D-glutamate ligase [Deltaproteobacteria bacterium]